MVYSLKNDSTLADLVLNNIGEAGQIKRKAYQRRLPENPNKDYYYILRETGNTEPILIEYGFIDNTKDATRLKNNLLRYVEGAVKAIAEYTGYPYSPPKEEMSTPDTYIVQKGDTLYAISKRFNIPIDTIKKINSLTSDTLSIGQTIYLIEKPNLNTYIVQRGDTLYSIALKNNTTVEKLKELNHLLDNNLSINQELFLPEEETEEYDFYTVQKGDSLWKIANQYNIPVTELIEINQLKDLTLQINQKLLVPKIEQANNTYTVEKGDTLWSIARKEGLTIEELKALNNLQSNLLSIGQILKIK